MDNPLQEGIAFLEASESHTSITAINIAFYVAYITGGVENSKNDRQT